MKRFFTLFTTVVVFLYAHAQVGYVIPYTPDVAYSDVSSVYDYIPQESYNGVEESPERKAYEWFNGTYTNAAGTQYFTIKDVKDGKLLSGGIPTIKALWVNVDKLNLANLGAAGFDDDVIDSIENYVKAGGNLLLTKQATRLAHDIGRMALSNDMTWPTTGTYNNSGTLAIQPLLGSSLSSEKQRDASHHPIYAGMSDYELVSGKGVGISGYNNDANYSWKEMYRTDGTRTGNGEISQLNNFQSDWSCSVLALQGNITDFCLPVILEFHPKGVYKGTILTIGSAAYQWGTNNSKIDNVKKLTSNALNYLSAGGTKYGYYMPYALSELYSTDTYHADYQTAKWFYDNYVVTNKGRFIHKGEAIPSPSQMTVLWVNNDRVGQESDPLKTAFGGDDFVNALSDFVEEGGNVFLSKQATRFIGDIGRVKWWPSYGVSIEPQGKPDVLPWYMVDNFVAVTNGTPGGGGVSLHNHPVYATLRATKANQYAVHDDEGSCKWPLFDGEGNRTKMTYIWGEPTTVWNDIYKMSSGSRTIDYATVTSFENNPGMQCKILGGWGHTTALDAVGFAEFPPATIDAKTFGGTVICIGLPAYQWSVGNTYIGNVRALTQGILDYLGGVVVVTEPGTTLINTTVDDLVVYQGGSVSNAGNITVKNSITYVRPAVGGTAGNALGSWYTFCLPFTPSSVKVLDEDDGFDYDIKSVYLTGSEVDTSNPQGYGHFYLQTFSSFDNVNTHWDYIRNEGIPTPNKPYIIKFLSSSENNGLANYFDANPVIKFIGNDPQTIYGTHDGTEGEGAGDFTFHVNNTLRKLELRNIYPLNTETNAFEYDYGGTSTIMPFECYIKASSTSVANACPRIMIGRRTPEQNNTATPIENLTIDNNSPVLVYDLMGRLCYETLPASLPQGMWIIRQGQTTRTIVIP